jgi:hypothetical protein
MAEEVPRAHRTWGAIAHLAGLAGYLIPFGSILAPLLVWKTKGPQSSFVADQAKESLNFQISMTLFIIIGAILAAGVIGIPLLLLLPLVNLVAVIVAAVRAGEGVQYRHRACWRFVE